MSTEEQKAMSAAEIRELMELNGWSETKLASELNLSQFAVKKWLVDDRKPSGPASILMRQWLTEARRKVAKVASA